MKSEIKTLISEEDLGKSLQLPDIIIKSCYYYFTGISENPFAYYLLIKLLDDTEIITQLVLMYSLTMEINFNTFLC